MRPGKAGSGFLFHRGAKIYDPVGPGRGSRNNRGAKIWDPARPGPGNPGL